MKTISQVATLLVALFGNAALCVAQAPVPEFYGFYALYGGKLHDTYKDAAANDYPSNIEFIIFSQGPQKIDFFFLPPEKSAPGAAPQFAGWNDWFSRIDQSQKAFAMAMDHGVPANAVEVQYRTGPYAGRSDLLRVVPTAPLPPGFYQLAVGVRFWVQKSEVNKYYQAKANPVTMGSTSLEKGASAPRAGVSAPVRLEWRGGMVYIAKSDGAISPLGKQAATLKYVCCGGKKVVELADVRSENRIRQKGDTSFLLGTPTGGVQKRFRGYEFEIKNGKRTAEVRKGKGLPCSFENFGSDGKFLKVTPQGDLTPGEYASGPIDPPVPDGGGTIDLTPFGVDIGN